MAALPPLNLDLALSSMSSFTGKTGAAVNDNFTVASGSASASANSSALPTWALVGLSLLGGGLLIWGLIKSGVFK